MPHAAGLWYEWHGPEGAETLVLSAGLGGMGSYWAPNLDALAARYRVLIYDHRGTGRSDRELPDKVTVEDMAAELAALLDALGIRRAQFLGHALGGHIGLALALGRSDLLAKLIVCNAWARLDPYTARCFDVRLALLRGCGPEMFVRAQPIFLYPPDWVSLHSERLDAEAQVQLAHLPPASTIEKRIAAVRAFDVLDRLADIETEILVLVGGGDSLVPYGPQHELAEGLPRGQLAFEFGGHAMNVTMPERFNDIVLRWLAGEYPIEE